MRKLMKILAIFMVIVLLATMAGILSACDQKTQIRDENVVQISYTIASYGDDWIKEAVKEFNELYKDKGLSAVLDRSDPLFTTEKLIQEVKYYESNPYDLYFTISENVVTQLMDVSYAVLKERNVGILECLDDVYASAPIGTDGNEESGTIESTRNPSLLLYQKYYSDNPLFDNKYYALQWTSANAGIGINTDVLSDFGYDHAPRTTMEMKEMCDTVLNSNAIADTGNRIYPMTWAGQNASGFLAYDLYTWIAQYMGIEDFYDFFAIKPKTGTTIDNGYDVYDNDGILYGLKAAETFIDEKYACAGTVTTINHHFSDQILIDGEALFSITGDWFYNELKGMGYTEEECSKIEMIPVPILSEIADLIGLQGTAETKDAVLRDIVEGIDEGKSDSEVASSIRAQTVTDSMVARVREARGMYYDLGYTHCAIIPSYSNAKGAAKEFLRFISSKSFCENIYTKNAQGVTPNLYANSTGNNYLKSLKKICKSTYSTPVGEATVLSRIRMNGGISFTLEPMNSYPDMAKGMAIKATGYDAQTIYDNVKNGMFNSWDIIVSTAGMLD